MTWRDAVRYLDGEERGWLLLVDGADSPDLDLHPYLPVSTHGTLIITTRNGGSVNYAPGSAIHVGGLEESEAVNLLHTVANIYPTSDTNSLEIVRELGMLAVAITQAGAFIHQTQRIDTYLEILHQHRSQLPSEPDSGDGPLTYAAFDLSFRQLPAKAQNFLKLCAFLHKSQIPVRLFEDSAKSDFITYTVHDYFPPPKSEKVFTSSIQEILGSTHDELPFHDVVDAASRASLIDISADGLFYTIQSPFQMYIKDHLAENEAHHYTHMMVQLLLGAIWPLDESNARFWRLLPHADAIPRAVQANDIAHALAFCQLYDSLGKWEACRELLEIALSQLQKTREETHAESIWLMSRLATMLLHCNRSEEAERMQQRILALQVDILGQQHPDTITTMNDLANTLYVRGRLQDAEELQRGVLALRLKILGQRHADTILTMSHLAATLHARGQWDKAETMQREVLDLRLQILGERSLDTVKAMSDLAATLSDSDQLDEAVEMERRVVGLQGDIAGKQHPNTIKAMGECAKILRKHGQLDEAEAVQRDISALSSGPSGRNPAM
ncbi:related to kinesin light chain [Serendipita indica DSM 11827]|uniref:Related to kinesin light chain n=1 Tax=Serendipita indica (strain DSM 11827) TaxID=1109443 RepID=G4TYA4_SERID|nr:related to kinesin light chain [Serendipita indica DSM 11827]